MKSYTKKINFNMQSVSVADTIGNFLQLMQLLFNAPHTGLNPNSLVREAALGHTENVQRILTEHPTQVCESALRFISSILLNKQRWKDML